MGSDRSPYVLIETEQIFNPEKRITLQQCVWYLVFGDSSKHKIPNTKHYLLRNAILF